MTWAYLTEQGNWQPCSAWLAVRVAEYGTVGLVETAADAAQRKD